MAHRFWIRLVPVSAAALVAACGSSGSAPAPTPSPRGGAPGAASAPPNSAHGGPLWNQASPDPDRIILTWSDDPATTQSVTWRTDASARKAWGQLAPATPSPLFEDPVVVVEARTETVDVRHVERAGVLVNYHSVTFTDLEPGLLYAYRVGDGERWSEWFQFRTASREAEPFTFLYFGDAQNDILSLWSRTIRAGFAEAPKARFMVFAGDLINRAHSDREWGEWYRAAGHISAMIPSVAAPGNHEYGQHTTVQGDTLDRRLSVFWRPQFAFPVNGAPGTTPESNYYLDYQGVRIVVLNSSENQESQARWLDRVLAESPARWTVAVHHHPIFSAAGNRDNEGLRDAWKPIYDRHGVDLVLQGHDHTYARGRTRAESDDPDAGSNPLDEETGTVYVVSVSGPKMYSFKEGSWDGYQATLDRMAEDTQLFQTVTVDGNTLRYRAYTATGEPYDAFDLVKEAGRPNRLVDRTSRED